MGDDDLHKPLGMMVPGPDRPRRRRALIGVAAGGVVLGLAAAFMAADPRGGEPFAVASLPAPPKPQPSVAPPAAADPAQTGSIRASAIASPRAENGVTIVRADQQGGTGSGPLIIKVPQALGLSEVAPVDKRLIEPTRYGPLPRIAADGARASVVYARPPVFSGPAGAGTPRVAIVVGGLGIDPGVTGEAIGMPPAVTLAFSPYGERLDALAERAKASGHEVLLQLATALGGDAARPAPHALRAGATSGEMIDDLHWLMSRMSGYVGVSNFHSGLLAEDHAAMTTIFGEIGGRGLLYVDDASSQVATGLGATAADLPTARADLLLDAQAEGATVRAATVKLEALARAKGSAIVVVEASAANVAAMSGFAASLETRGLKLVPVSSLADAAAPTVARAR